MWMVIVEGEWVVFGVNVERSIVCVVYVFCCLYDEIKIIIVTNGDFVV